MPDGTVQHVRHQCVIPLSIQDYHEHVTLDVLPVLTGYDIVQNKPRLFRHNPVIDWQLDTISMRGDVPCTLWAGVSKPAAAVKNPVPEPITAKSLEKAVK